MKMVGGFDDITYCFLFEVNIREYVHFLFKIVNTFFIFKFNLIFLE